MLAKITNESWMTRPTLACHVMTVSVQAEGAAVLVTVETKLGAGAHLGKRRGVGTINNIAGAHLEKRRGVGTINNIAGAHLGKRRGVCTINNIAGAHLGKRREVGTKINIAGPTWGRGGDLVQ